MDKSVGKIELSYSENLIKDTKIDKIYQWKAVKSIFTCRGCVIMRKLATVRAIKTGTAPKRKKYTKTYLYIIEEGY